MPPKVKKQSANQHDKRHENGLAAPGKRVDKKLSNGNINGYTNGKPQSATPPPLPSTGLNHMTFPLPAHSTIHGTSFTANSAPVGKLQEEGTARTSSEGSLDEVDACRSRNMAVDVATVSANKLDNTAIKPPPPAPQRVGTLALATTILKSCPLRDVIAILIILLQLPPTIITVIHFLFATLTFVTPPTGTSTATFPSIAEMFQASGDMPSLATVVFVDVVVLILWLVMWAPAQIFILDLAQAVIAISLGGAAAGKNGNTNSAALCFMMILLKHTTNYSFLRDWVFKALPNGMHRVGIGPITSSGAVHVSVPVSRSWPRRLLGIHILTQGVLTMVRRWFQRRGFLEAASSPRKTDPEAALVLNVPRRNSASVDPNADIASGSSTDGRPPGPSPAIREPREKSSSGKKRRKQAMQVRSEQPFWAALASTKVTVLKEYEINQSSTDAIEASATDKNHVGNANFTQQDNRIWMSQIGATEISFGASLLTGVDRGFGAEHEVETTPSSGIDKSKPFYVRINGADWGSTRISEDTSGDNAGDGQASMWTGEIFGLTPLSNYLCEFVRRSDDTVITSTSVITHSAPSAEQASIVPPPTHQSLRPSSPTTTLKNSVAAAEAKLADNRHRLKRNRKDHKTAITNVKRESDALRARLSSSGGNDERLRQRSLQIQQHYRQAEDAVKALESDVEAQGEIPEDETNAFTAKKDSWEASCNAKAAAQKVLDEARAEADRQISHLSSELTLAQQKRERLQARLTKLKEQHDRLLSANAQDHEMRMQRAQKRAADIAGFQRAERDYLVAIEQLEQQAQTYHISTSSIVSQVTQLENLSFHQQQHSSSGSTPRTPEGNLPGTTTTTTAAAAAGPRHQKQPFQFPGLEPQPEHPTSNPASLYREGRGRSSSMLSGASGLTDDLDFPASTNSDGRPGQYGHEAERQGSEGGSSSGSGGSGSGSGSGSQEETGT
ncbi:hypothetical protein LTR04_005629, partial [Oleoguttula sp. CCFEE 6159]